MEDYNIKKFGVSFLRKTFGTFVIVFWLGETSLIIRIKYAIRRKYCRRFIVVKRYDRSNSDVLWEISKIFFGLTID